MSESDDLYLITFRVGGELYSLPVARVREIVQPPAVTLAAPSPDFGADAVNLIKLRGITVPVVDLSRRFDRPATLALARERESDGNSRVLVVEVAGRLVGLRVDEVREVITRQADQSNQSEAAPVDVERMLSVEGDAAFAETRAAA
jgi:purine-binding chemotaxis protein CheW